MLPFKRYKGSYDLKTMFLSYIEEWPYHHKGKTECCVGRCSTLLKKTNKNTNSETVANGRTY